MPLSSLFILGSTRHSGNTELFAREAAAKLPPDVRQTGIDLATHPLTDVADQRHTRTAYAPPRATRSYCSTQPGRPPTWSSPPRCTGTRSPGSPSATSTTGRAGSAPPASTSRPR